MDTFIRHLGRLSRTLNKIGGCIFLPILTVLITTDVTLRYVFNAPLTGGLEASRILLLLVFLLGIPECTRLDGHIRMEMLYIRMPPGLKRVVTLLYAIVGISIFGLLAKSELKEIKYNMSLSRATEYLDIPIWPFHALIMFVSLCLIVQFLLYGTAAIRGHTWPEENR
jgi:TRAP-type C4-dicarboxylate transport system permease small subunit